MIIKQISLNSFGKFKNRRVDFEDGINLIYGENENGKSTIKNFVEIILAGLSDVRLMEQYSKEIKKYRPWHSKEEYFGSIECEDDESFIIQKDFNDLKDIKIYYKDTMEEVVENATIDKVRSLGLIGISEMKGAKGRELIAEVINRISNIKKSNVNGLKYDDIVRKINQKITQIENSEEYQSAKRELLNLDEHQNTLESAQKAVKELMKEQKDLELEMRILNRDLSSLKERTFARTIDENKKKYERIIDINREIEQNKLEIEKLSPITNLESVDVQNFIEMKENLEQLQKTLNSNTELLQSLEGEIREISDNMDQETFVKLREASVREDLKAHIKMFKSTEKDIEYIKKKIDRYSEMVDLSDEMIDEQNPSREFTEQEIKRLEKDYYKYINTKDWKKHLESSEELLGKIKTNQSKIERHMKEAKKYVPRMILGSAVLLISLVFIIVVGFVPYVLAFIGAGVGLFVLSYLQRNKEITPIPSYEAKIESYNEKIHNNEALKEKYKEKLDEILKNYDCKSQEEFYALFKNAMPVKDKTTSRIESKISNLENDEDKLYVKRRVTIGKINNCLSTNFNVDDPLFNEKIKDIEDYILLVSYDFSGKEEKISGLKETIEKLKFDIKVNKKDFEQHPIYIDDLVNQLDKIDEMKSIKRQLENNNRNLLTSRGELLRGTSEEELEKIYRSIINKTYDVESLEKSTVYDKDLNELKDKQITGLEQITKIKNKILAYSDKLVNSKNHLVGNNYYKHIVDEANCKIETLKVIKEKFEIVSNMISDSYSKQIVEKMNKILYNVTNKYDDMKIAEDMSVYFRDNQTNEWISINNLSLGTIDQAYFALRVGLTDSVLSNINLPIVLDDSFIQYDQYRLANILEELSKMKRQVIILSCHLREKKILERKGIDFNFIELANQ